MKGCRRKGESVEAKTVRGRDSQLQDLNSRFSESVTTLLRFSVALDPKKNPSMLMIFVNYQGTIRVYATTCEPGTSNVSGKGAE